MIIFLIKLKKYANFVLIFNFLLCQQPVCVGTGHYLKILMHILILSW